MVMTSRFALLCSLLCAVVAPAGAAGQPAPSNFRTTEALPIAQAGGSTHGSGISTAPSEVTMPHVGKATVVAEWVRSNLVTCGPPPCLNSTEGRLSVEVVTRRGRLVIAGTAGPFFVPSGSPLPPPSAVMSGDWVVGEASGRFAGYTGAGTWSVNPIFGPPPALGTMTVTLVGHLGKQ